MKMPIDIIYIELIVVANQTEFDIWMSGSLEITINGEKPYGESDIIDYDALLESLESDGEYFIFSCCCGLPKCSGWLHPIKVIHSESQTKWINLNSNKIWHFDKSELEEQIKTINNEVKIFKKYFREKEIEYVGYGFNLQVEHTIL
ncbi:hypothetical protein LPB87_10080 [Flavobacterium sp. EDS]|uniref:hypothetical protein n=1 Tax=Flavobacterium sp. EDS TaxID=2897328 RepID=UPI001E3AC1E0|nr:hypothetical protein [Flavobacterium sp. EDS]MCD0474736.1 hypothetical protein [Flavobacterium sp. EDS]